MRTRTAQSKAFTQKKIITIKKNTHTKIMSKSNIKLIAVLERTGGFASAQELHQILRREGDGI
jgi:Fur family ferric uptake transcriptional regulator